MTFGSLDNVEDALDQLDRDDFPYLFFMAQGDEACRIYSNLGEESQNIETMREMIESGAMQEMLQNHMDEFYPSPL